MLNETFSVIFKYHALFLVTCVMKRLKEFLLELLLVFKAPQGIHGFDDILVNELFRGNYVCLDHFHHGSF